MSDPREKQNGARENAGVINNNTVLALQFGRARSSHFRHLARAVGIDVKTMSSAQVRSRAKDFVPRHLRRRTTAHARRKKMPPRKKNHTNTKNFDKMRTHHRDETKMVVEQTATSSQARKLSTHRWHSKRMEMVDLWGYKVGLHRKDRGIRAAYRSQRDICTLHDMSYYECVQLRGDAFEEIQTLMKILTCQQDPISMDSMIEYSLPLFNENRALICLLKFSWSPSSKASANLWIHSAAFEESLETLSKVISQKNEERNWNLKLAKLKSVRYEIRGTKAMSIAEHSLSKIGWDFSKTKKALAKMSKSKHSNMALIYPESKNSYENFSSLPTLLALHSQISGFGFSEPHWKKRAGIYGECVEIIVPEHIAGCVWLGLVMGCGHVVGIQERRILRAELGFATFPWDYIETGAGKREWARIGKKIIDNRMRRPKGKRRPILTERKRFIPQTERIENWNKDTIWRENLLFERKKDGLVGVVLEAQSKGIPIAGSDIVLASETTKDFIVGTVTFGGYSYGRGKGFCIGFVTGAAYILSTQHESTSDKELPSASFIVIDMFSGQRSTVKFVGNLLAL
mmetsp:Transcript_4298/g.6426  ORF Transcript_4298/g.6426 Transcript_4298/m.6426 type:complete len:571 (+) Transcript_4298:19-1731(+)